VALRSDDVAPKGYAIDRANVRQRKTGRSVRFELTEPTRQAVDDYLRGADRKSGEYLFPGLGIRAATDDAPVCSASIKMGSGIASTPADSPRILRTEPKRRRSIVASHGEPPRRRTFARPFKERKHRSLPRCEVDDPLRSPRQSMSDVPGQSGPAPPRARLDYSRQLETLVFDPRAKKREIPYRRPHGACEWHSVGWSTLSNIWSVM